MKIKLKSRTSPIPYEIICDLEDFKPKDMVELIRGIELTIKAIMEEIKKI